MFRGWISIRGSNIVRGRFAFLVYPSQPPVGSTENRHAALCHYRDRCWNVVVDPGPYQSYDEACDAMMGLKFEEEDDDY